MHWYYLGYNKKIWLYWLNILVSQLNIAWQTNSWDIWCLCHSPASLIRGSQQTADETELYQRGQHTPELVLMLFLVQQIYTQIYIKEAGTLQSWFSCLFCWAQQIYTQIYIKATNSKGHPNSIIDLKVYKILLNRCVLLVLITLQLIIADWSMKISKAKILSHIIQYFFR